MAAEIKISQPRSSLLIFSSISFDFTALLTRNCRFRPVMGTASSSLIGRRGRANIALELKMIRTSSHFFMKQSLSQMKKKVNQKTLLVVGAVEELVEEDESAINPQRTAVAKKKRMPHATWPAAIFF